MFKVILLLVVGFCTATGTGDQREFATSGKVGDAVDNSQRGFDSFPSGNSQGASSFGTGDQEFATSGKVGDAVDNSQSGFDSFPSGNSQDASSFGVSQQSYQVLAAQAIFDEWDHTMRLLDDTGRDVYISQTWADDIECKFPGDDAPNFFEYCATVYKLYYEGLSSNPSRSLTLTHSANGNSAGENSATLQMKSRYQGKIPFVNLDVDREMTIEVTYKKQGFVWLMSKATTMGNDQGSFADLKSQYASKVLRDAVVSAKQSYPEYNPVLIVGGSALAGFMSIMAGISWSMFNP